MGDYAAVIVFKNASYNPTSTYGHANGSNRDWRHYFQFGEWLVLDDAAKTATGYNTPQEMYVGPFRVCILNPAAVNTWRSRYSWKPRDAMSWWRDGASNQILFGEKHIPASRIGTCRNEPYGFIDCSYLLVSNRNHATAGRVAATTLSQKVIAYNAMVSSENGSPESDFAFGSWHPGVCQFLIGDGAVRSFAVSTSQILFCNLSDVQDGIAQTLP